jgi:hypothetical protein
MVLFVYNDVDSTRFAHIGEGEGGRGVDVNVSDGWTTKGGP